MSLELGGGALPLPSWLSHHGLFPRCSVTLVALGGGSANDLPSSLEKMEERVAILQNTTAGISLVVQWLRSALAMEGVWVRSLVRELGATCRN